MFGLLLPCAARSQSCPTLNTEFSFVQSPCDPRGVQFIAVNQPGVTYSWNFNGVAETPSNPNSFVYTYNFPTLGTFPVTLTVTAYPGCSASETRNITFQLQPADIILTPDTVICLGKQVTLHTAASLNWCWTPTDYLDSPYSSASPTASPPVTTTYHYTALTTGPNLIVNGDFEAGNTGFSSAYVYDPVNMTEGEYYVGTDPNAWNRGTDACGDHTTGAGNMLLINGSPVAGTLAWSETVTVIPNTNYAFSAWITSIDPTNPAILQFSINGNPLGVPGTASSASCTWNQFYTTWNSGNNTTAVISLIDGNSVRTGNDFALDDISFGSFSMETDSVTITVDNAPFKAGPDTTVCAGQPVQLQAAGMQGYVWTPATGLSNPNIGDPVDTPAVSTAYIVTAITANGCMARDTVNVNVFPPTVVVSPDTSICLGSPVRLSATGGLSYSWTPGQFLDDPAGASPVANITLSTRFYVAAIDVNHCSETDSVLVSIYPVPVFHSPPAEQVCKGFGVPLTSKNPPRSIYSWSPAVGLDNPSAPAPLAHPDSSTTYVLQISDSVCKGYDSSFSVQVTVLPSPDVTAHRANDIDCAEHTSQLDAAGASSYTWTPASGLDDPSSSDPVASIDSTTTFVVRGTNDNGCYAFDSVTVKVADAGANTFVVPNAFTPNGDGHNDCWGVRHWGDVRLDQLSVYDRWGEEVFTSRNPSECWDGTFKGKRLAAGSYAYVIRAHSFCGFITRTGVVLLIR